MLGAGGHLLLEGPVGVGKTTVALAVCRHLGRETVRVDGDERYTENKMTGWFDPPLVLKVGYGEESFFPGPLVRAMREGAVLFINELNRMPESVQNVLLPALDEHLLILPR
ncbi:MAG: MoxR family ATPase, partial [Spirochaetes bacterium]|nr:MoxR family ATPase [Spirochaetota bacterium]